MSLARCVVCGLPVLELKGEYANLDSFYIQDDGPPADTAGQWHALCLAKSSVARSWHDVRVNNFRDVRGYVLLARLPSWTLLEHSRTREVLAFGHDGRLLNLSLGGKSKARKVAGGAVYPVELPEYHLRLEQSSENAALIASIQEALSAKKEYPLPLLVDALSINDRIMHPVALERGRLLFERRLRRSWESDTVSVVIEYGVFVPDELEAFVGAKQGGSPSR
jgi:hypothetical protein